MVFCVLANVARLVRQFAADVAGFVCLIICNETLHQKVEPFLGIFCRWFVTLDIAVGNEKVSITCMSSNCLNLMESSWNSFKITRLSAYRSISHQRYSAWKKNQYFLIWSRCFSSLDLCVVYLHLSLTWFAVCSVLLFLKFIGFGGNGRSAIICSWRSDNLWYVCIGIGWSLLIFSHSVVECSPLAFSCIWRQIGDVKESSKQHKVTEVHGNG